MNAIALAQLLSFLKKHPKVLGVKELSPLPVAAEGVATLLFDGKIYAIGGRPAGVHRQVNVYDPATGSWTTKNNFPVDIWMGGGGVVEGQLYVGMGVQGYGSNLYDFYRYTPASDSWTKVTTIPGSSNGMRGLAYEGKLYAVTGGSSYAWDPVVGGSWTSLGNPASDQGPLLVGYDGKIYALANTKVSVYTPGSGWGSLTTPLRYPLAGSGSNSGAIDEDGTIYMVGNYTGGYRMPFIQTYNVVTEETGILPVALPVGLDGVSTELLGGKLYAIGGYAGGSQVNTTYEISSLASELQAIVPTLVIE